MSFFSSLSSGAKALVYVGLVVAAAGVVTAFYPQIWWIMLLGLAVVGLLLISFKLLLTLRDRKRGKDTNAKVLSASQGRGGVTDAGDQAALDDLQKKFSTGVDTLDSLGLDLYALPWFVIVGQPASGKTEAIRRCKIPFPPGLTDELQGTGGTVNMDWWFTNDAVILDTAGKMLFQEAGQGTSEEWVRFLKLVREARPHCPINGMLLVIPADSLISDSPEQLDQNAKTIAAQLNLIQRTLGVRFPVFVLITKCDLITGFREFFDTLDDRRHQQMLGWSNPDELDTPFDPGKVRDHLATVRGRLEKLRFQLMQDPVSSAGNFEHRLDEVDRLFDFPSAMQGISESLQRQLEIIFSGSKLAPKPLFLRGIYFTSSIQKGSILDGVLAQAMGVPLDKLTESRPFERVRPLFLRDLFMDKIFAEGGLVTRADNTHKLKARRRMLVLGTMGVGAVLLLGLSWLGFRTFQISIGDQGDVWTGIASTVSAEDNPSLVMETSPGSGVYMYNGDRDPTSRSGDTAMDELPNRTLELAEQKIDVPFIFRLTSGLKGDLLRQERQQAHQQLMSDWVVRPLVEVSASKLKGSPDYNTPETAQALAQLVRLRTLQAGQAPVGAPVIKTSDTVSRADSPIDLPVLLRYIVKNPPQSDAPSDLEARRSQLEKLQGVFDATFKDPADRERMSTRALAGQITDKQLTDAVEVYLDAQTKPDTGKMGPVQQINALALELIAMEEAEIRLLQVDDLIDAGKPEEALTHWSQWSAGEDRTFVSCSDRVLLLHKSLTDQGYDLSGDANDVYQQAIDTELKQIANKLSPLRNQLPKAGSPDSEGLPIGDGPSKDAYPASLKTLINAQLATYQKNLLTHSAETQGELGRLMKKYLSQTRSMQLVSGTGPDRPASLLSEMYLTTQQFRPNAPETLALSDLAPSIAKIDEALEQAKRDIKQRTRLADPDDTGFNLAYEHCELLLNLRARYARSALVELAANETADKESIKRSVERFAAQYKGEAWDPPQIKLSVGYDPDATAPFVLDPKFHPEGLKQYLGDWNSVLGSLDEQALKERFAEPEKISNALQRMAVQLNPYFMEYLNFWAGQAVTAADYKPITDWEAYRKAVGSIRVSTVQNGLSRLSKQVEDALAVVPVGTMSEQDQETFKQKLDQAQTKLTATSQTRSNVTSAAESVLRHWQNVGDLTIEVDRIRRSSPTNFQSVFLTDLYAPGNSRSTIAFWSGFTLNPLDLAADAGGLEFREAQDKLAKDYLKFPLFKSEARDKPLSAQQVREANTYIAVLSGGTSNAGYPEGSIGAGGKLGDDTRINAILDRLRGWTNRSDEEQAKIERLSKIANALGDNNGLKVKLHLPKEAFLVSNKPTWAEKMQPAFNRYPEVGLSDKIFDTSAPRVPDNLSIDLPADGLKLTFMRQRSQAEGGGNDPVTVEIAYEKPWSAIRAILPTEKAGDIKVIDGVFWVPVQLPAGPGDQPNTTYYYMIGLEFDADLPAPADWPTR